MKKNLTNTRILLALGVLTLVGCQTGASTPEQSVRAEKVQQADLRNAQAFCAMIDEANRITVSQRKLVPDNDDCGYFKRNGTMVGYSPAVRNQYTGFFHNFRDVSTYSRAQNASLPPSVANDPTMTELYRKLLIRGFTSETAQRVSQTKVFLTAATAFREAQHARKAA